MMIKKLCFILTLLTLFSCQKVEDRISETFNSTKEKVKNRVLDETKTGFEEQIERTIHAITKIENAEFSEVFPQADDRNLLNFRGRKAKLPTGTLVYIFRFNTDKEAYLNLLENQPALDGKANLTKAEKIDGASIIDKIKFLEKFIPTDINTDFIQDIKTQHNIEFYQLKRSKEKNTLIYNPKTEQFLQLIEIK